MGRAEEVAAKVREGLTPSEIAGALGVAQRSALAYLDTAVGKGLIRRSDIYFTLARGTRQSPSTPEDQETVSRFGSAAHAMGDMYEDLRDIESTLHTKIRSSLEREHGTGKKGWWLQVPLQIRNKCNERCEADGAKLDPYQYTDLLDLRYILEKNWKVLQIEVGDFASDRPRLLKQLERLNEVRKMVMHPARGMRPSESDFQFIRELRKDLQL